jgi:hypothetical protein
MITVDSPQIGHPQIGQVFIVRRYCGDARAVIQPNSCPDTDEVFKRFFGGIRRMPHLRTVNCRWDVNCQAFKRKPKTSQCTRMMLAGIDPQSLSIRLD